MAVVWQPFCAQAIVDGYGQYPTLDHNRSQAVGGLISVLAVNRGFMERNRDAVQRLVVAYLDVLKVAQADPTRWARIYAEKAGLPEAWPPNRSASRSSTRSCRSSRSSASRSSCPKTG